jgi:hypothetical protein
MLRSLAEPTGYRLLATDGEIGRCRDFLFDDERWTVRYMVADTGRWLPGRKILISRAFLERADWEQQRFPVRLTRRQIEMAPPLDNDAPISRRYEQTYHDFFKTPYYWAGNGLWGNYPFPEMAMPPEPPPVPETPQGPPEAVHLRSLREVTGYQVAATDGEAGRIVDFVVDDRSWALRFAVLDTSRLPFSKKLLIATEWIDEVSWIDQQIRVGVTAEQIKGAPEFDSRTPVNEAQETVLYDYYGRRRGLAADRQARR